MTDWKKYERLVSAFCSEEYSDGDTTVIANASVIGALSGKPRQVDVLIEKRFSADLERRIIIDAKRHSRKVSMVEVEKFEGMMRDCRAEHGFLVCPVGFTAGARARAQKNMTLRLLTIEELERFSLDNFEPCHSSICLERKEGGVFCWHDPFAITLPGGLVSIFAVGKCNGCHSYHIWCFSCGEKFHLSGEDEYYCSCKMPWFWLTAREDDFSESGAGVSQSLYLLLVTSSDIYMVDRIPVACGLRGIIGKLIK